MPDVISEARTRSDEEAYRAVQEDYASASPNGIRRRIALAVRTGSVA